MALQLPDIQSKIAANIQELRSIDPTSGDEARSRFDALEAETRALAKDRDRLHVANEMERLAAATPVNGTGNREFDREARSYSLTRAIAHAAGLRVDAAREVEISDEIARLTGRSAQGIFAPDSVFQIEKRVVVPGTNGAGLIFEEGRPQDFIDALRANLVTGRLGATTLSGLQGNVSIPKLAASAGTAWVADNASIGLTDPDFDKVTMAPKHVASRTEFSRDMLLQSSPDIERLLRNDFATSLAIALDKAATTGGGSNEPSGIIDRLTDASAMGTLSDASWAQVLTMIADVEQANAATGRLGWALNPAAVRTLRSTPKVVYGSPVVMDAGAGFVMDGPNELAGYAAASTTSLPLAGGSPASLGTAIFGDWSSLLIGYWSGVDVLANPYGEAYPRGGVQVRGILTADVAVRHLESFTAAQDVPASS